MDRRQFINLSSLATAGITIQSPVFGSPFGPTGNEALYAASEPPYTIHHNGSFDIGPENLKIRNCYPVIDEKQIMPVSVEIGKSGEGDFIRYTLSEGSVILYFTRNGKRLLLKSALEGFKSLPYWFKPIGYGEAGDASRFYKQGFGFAGPSGVFPFPSSMVRIEGDRLKEEAWSYDSYLVSGLLNEDGQTLGWTVTDNHHFLNRTTFFNRYHRFGLIDRHSQINDTYVETGFSTENIAAKNRTEFPAISFVTGSLPYETFRTMMTMMALDNGIRNLKPPGHIWCSWYEFEQDFSYDMLQEFISGMKNMNEGVDVNVIQIDAGYCEMGDWLIPNEKWPEGIEKAMHYIRDNGYTPGIWVGPFRIGVNSQLTHEHPDWMLKDLQGEIITENEYHMLDSSHPDAFQYLRKVFRTFYSYGIRYFKTDFLDWGYQDSTRVKRYTPGKTSAEYYHEVIAMIREEIRDDSYWLACISPYQPVVGYVDAVRVSNDVHPRWNRESTGNMFREMWYGQIFNNILWQNDPDVLYLRDQNSTLTRDEKYSIAIFDGIIGGVVGTSDRFYTLNEASLYLWRLAKPAGEHRTATVLDWDGATAILKLKRKLNSHLMAFLAVNISDKEDSFIADMAALSGFNRPFLYRFLPPGDFNAFTESGSVSLKLKAHESVLIYISETELNSPGQFSLSGVHVN